MRGLHSVPRHYLLRENSRSYRGYPRYRPAPHKNSDLHGVYYRVLNDGKPIEPCFGTISPGEHFIKLISWQKHQVIASEKRRGNCLGTEIGSGFLRLGHLPSESVHGCWIGQGTSFHGYPRTGWCKWANCPDAASCPSLQRMVSASLHQATTRRGSSGVR